MANKTAKKNAKMGHTRSKAAPPEETSVSNLVMLTGRGCRVSTSIQSTADCGRPRIGWRYGDAKDVTCKDCLGG